MKNVLIVSYRYPPQSYVGSLRTGKFAKYLPDFGWRPIVLTVEPENCDFCLPDEIKIGEVIRTRDFDLRNKLKIAKLNPNKHLFGPSVVQTIQSGAMKCFLWTLNECLFPDSYVGWYWIVKKKYANGFKSHHIDLMFTSSPPPTVHLVGNFLRKKLEIPWIADFRDLWTQKHTWRRIYPLWKAERKLEQWALRSSDGMITVSNPLATQLRTLHGKTVWVLTNGFDEDDYNHRPIRKRSGNFRIIYTGNIYRHKQDPSSLLEAVKDLLGEGFIQQGEVKIEFYGREVSEAKRISHKMNMGETVDFPGMVSYKESIRKQLEANILLFLEWTDSRIKGVYTGKIFEYLGARKPILAIGPKGGVVEKLLRETGAGRLASDVRETKELLKEWITVFREKGTVPYGGDYKLILSKYSRRSKARELATIFDSVVGKQK